MTVNRALIGACRKGYEAAERHVSKADIPYPDYRAPCGGVTFSRAFRRAWWRGYDIAKAAMSRGDYDGWYTERLSSWNGCTPTRTTTT